MRKYISLVVGLLILILVCLSLLYFYGFYFAIPKYDDIYFETKYKDKYLTPEVTFNLLVEALNNCNKELYQEVLGQQLSEDELKLFKPYKGETPEIVTIMQKSKYAIIITDNNWEQHFERVKGRWVFSPENLGVLVRSFFIENF